MKNIQTLLILIIFIPYQCLALGESWVGKEVRAVGDVWLRDTPPQGLFCSKGNQVALIKSNDKVKVLEHLKVTCALVYSYDFLKVERLGSGIPEGKKYGFVAVKDKETGKALFMAGGE